MEIVEVYEKILRENDGKCSIRKLVAEARIYKNSAQKDILFYEVEMVPATRSWKEGRWCFVRLKNET